MRLAIAEPDRTPLRGGTLVYSIATGEPDNYDCHGTLGVSVIHRVGPHYSTLLRYDPDNYPAVVGDVTDSWSISEDQLAYTFRLHPNIKFHDGTPFGAADVKATYERLRNPAPGVVSARRAQFIDIVNIETPDDLTVVFRLSRPNASMLAVFANPYNCLYSARRLAEDPLYPLRHVMGTGPFKFSEHVAGSEWRGERFDGYFRQDKPYLDGFRAINLAGPAVVPALIAGQVMTDFRGVTPSEVERLAPARRGKLDILETVSSNMLMITFNTRRKPFDDVRVRRAMALAIDHWKGSAFLARQDIFHLVGGFQRPGSRYARSDDELAALPGFGHDIAASRREAVRLLSEAGVSDLKAVFLNRALYAPQGVYLIDQWRQIGITVTQDIAENQRYFAAYNGGNYDVVIDGFQAFPEDPVINFANFLPRDVNPGNMSFSNDEVLASIYERIKSTSDTATRKQLVNDFESRLLLQAYSVPLYWAKRYVPIANDVRGYRATPDYFIGSSIADIWIER